MEGGESARATALPPMVRHGGRTATTFKLHYNLAFVQLFNARNVGQQQEAMGERTTVIAAFEGPKFRDNPETALSLYHERGYHVEHELLSPATCDHLVEVAGSRPNASDRTFRPIPMPHRDHSAFLAVMRHRPIVEIVERLVGGKASAIGGEFFYMRPGTPGFSTHQDNYYIEAPPDAFVSVWIALCKVGPENGGLVFFPSTHRLGALPIRQGKTLLDPGQNPRAQAIECLVPDEFQATDVHLEKGSVAFFHGFLAHYSRANQSNGFRYSLLLTYIRSGSPFIPGRTQQRTEIDLYLPA